MRRPRREILIRAGAAAIRARLLDTACADRVWQALPIYSVVVIEDGLLQFAIPVAAVPEPAARRIVKPGEIAFWAEQGRVLIAFAPPSPGGGADLSLPAACNVWAVARDDVAALSRVAAGDRAALLEADS